MIPQAAVNERLKLAATALNNAGLAFIGGGAILQFVQGNITDWWHALIASFWVFLGVVLHGCGQFVLGFVR